MRGRCDDDDDDAEMRVSQREHGRTYIQGGMATTVTLRSRIRCSGMQLGERRESETDRYHGVGVGVGLGLAAGCWLLGWATPSARVLFCSVPVPGARVGFSERKNAPELHPCTHAPMHQACPPPLATTTTPAPMGTLAGAAARSEEWSSGLTTVLLD